MPKRDGKLSKRELTNILGPDRANNVLAQDRRCAQVYDDMERRTSDLEKVQQVVRKNGPAEVLDQLTDTFGRDGGGEAADG